MKIVCIGDSLTDGFGVPKVNAWPNVLQNELAVEINNKGISGDTSSGMLARFYHDVLTNIPTHVIICAGGNDLWWNVEVNSILANLYSMVKQAYHHKIVPILAIQPTIHAEFVDRETVWEPIAGYQHLQENSNELANKIMSMAKNNHFHLVDFRVPFLNQQNEPIGKYYEGTDGIHPNELGHIALAKQASQTIIQIN
ncbi:GDSL-type esterase/lipase family protein [Metabacillus sp. RGM 3146]|uniref:GDSL-type esterase/lipase family protein n=1 Tax=Metabacillus sp. RGM 3146 TaxID=3401092 RepID=UPI003B9A05C7